MNKKITVLMLISILLTSCGGVTPVPPTVTPTVTAISTRQSSTATPNVEPTEEQHASPSPQLWKHLPPSQLVDHYELTEWSPEFYKAVTNLLNDAEIESYLYEQSNDFRAAFASEAWLRAGSQMDDNSLLCDVKYYVPGAEYFPELRPGQDLFSFFVEDLLNNKGVGVDSLPEKFWDMFGRSECLFGFSLDVAGNVYFEPVYVQNLFGDGQESYVFAAGTQFTDNRVAIYAVHPVDGAYRVEKIRDWEGYISLLSGTQIKFVDVGDLNNNGRNEMVVQVNLGHSGFPPNESEWIYRYEWDPSSKAFLSDQKVTIFDQECFVSACYGTWEYKQTGNPNNLLLTTKEYFNTGIDACEQLIKEKNYLLANGTYSLKSGTLLTPESKLPACQVSWAYQILIEPNGWNNDKAIEIISDAISDWPKEMNAVWGKNSRSYFQLMLGIWRDFRGETEQSTSLFEDLVSLQSPTNPSFTGQLAKTYLSVRQQKGMVVACSEMNMLEDELLFEKYGQYATDFIGFGGNRWPHFVPSFCDEGTAIASSFSSGDASNVNGQESLKQWLVDQGKTDIYIHNVLIDNKELWLANFLNRTDQKDTTNIYQLWAFFNGPNGLDAVFLGQPILDINKTTEWYKENVVIFKSKQSPPILLVDVDDCLAFLYVPSGQMQILKNVCEYGAIFSIENGQVDFMTRDWYPSEWGFVSYIWDNATQSLQEITPHLFDFKSIEKQAAYLVYKENNYVGAIIYIRRALSTSPPDRVFWPDCYDYIASRADELEETPSITLCEQPMEFHRPYLLYLLGISYEMSGQPDKAGSTYYSLWHDYPTNIFGVAASLKLEEVSP